MDKKTCNTLAEAQMMIDHINHDEGLRAIGSGDVIRLLEALIGVVNDYDLSNGWKNEYSKRQPDTEIELLVWNPNGLGWFWSASDPVTEDHCVSANVLGFDTKEAAMKDAEDWYKNEWLPRFQATGERDFSHA